MTFRARHNHYSNVDSGYHINATASFHTFLFFSFTGLAHVQLDKVPWRVYGYGVRIREGAELAGDTILHKRR